MTFGTDAVIGTVDLGKGTVELVQNFVLGADELRIVLNNLPRVDLGMSDTLFNGAHAVSIYDTRDAVPTHGIILAGLPSSVTSGVLLAHVQSYDQNLAVIA